jgi:L-iditol 2-dehydrogenase
MKRAVLTGIKQIEVREEARPVLQHDDDVLLKISHVGICGSDMHYFKEGRIGEQVIEYPFTIGHECSAIIAATGRAVQGLEEGQRVFVEPSVPCLQCSQCRAGREHTCLNVRFLGAAGQISGGLAEYIVMPARNCFLLPDNIGLAQAALIEPLSIAYHAVRFAPASEKVQAMAILGAGPIGLSVLTILKALRRVSILITDKLDYRLQVAEKAGVNFTANPLRQNISVLVSEQWPQMLDVVFECAGQQETLDQGVDLLKPGGSLIIVGIPASERISFEIDKMRRKEISLFNVRRQNNAVLPVIELWKEGKISPDFMISHRTPLADAIEAFQRVAGYQDGVIKALIRVVEES